HGIERRLRNQSHYFRTYDRDAETLRLPLYHLEYTKQRRSLVVDHVHRDLNYAAVLQLETERLNIPQSAGLMPDRPGDLVGDLNLGGFQVYVVRDQWRARPYCGDTCGRVHSGFAEVGTPVLADCYLLADPLKLALAHRCKILAFRPRSRLFVKIDRYTKLRR